MTEDIDNLALPKMNTTGVLPDEAEMFDKMPFPRVPDGKVMLAVDDDGNVFNLGVVPALYVIDKPDSE